MVDTIAVDGLIQVTRWLSTLLLTDSSLCLFVIVIRYLNKDVFKIGQLEIPVHLLPVVLASMTVAHAYLTWLLNIKVENLVSKDSISARQAWEQIVGKSDSLVFNGMKARTLYDTHTSLGFVHSTSFFDPTFWLNFSFAFAVLIGVVVSRISRNEGVWNIRTLNSLVLGFILAIVNWLIGSYWAIKLSTLAK